MYFNDNSSDTEPKEPPKDPSTGIIFKFGDPDPEPDPVPKNPFTETPPPQTAPPQTIPEPPPRNPFDK